MNAGPWAATRLSGPSTIGPRRMNAWLHADNGGSGRMTFTNQIVYSSSPLLGADMLFSSLPAGLTLPG